VVIYLDSSVVLAQILMEDRRPPETFWSAVLVSSRLLEYEVWNRVHVRRLGAAGEAAAAGALAHVDLYELSPEYLQRALSPFPVSVRTLEEITLASYDHRLLAAAAALGIEPAPL
jgi:hypothetical protein